MPWRGPEYDGDFPSLGWEMVDWYQDLFIVPSGPRWGDPFKLTDEQTRFVVRWYAINPATGRFVYRRSVLRRIKGWGKSPFAGAIMLGELAGPTVFDGWNADGEPVAMPWLTPWVQIAATAEDQTDNTYVPLHEMAAHAGDELALDVGKLKITRIASSRFWDGQPGTLEPVTTEAATREGTPLTAGLLDESHLLKPRNGGVAMAATQRRNLQKLGGRSMETTNAPVPGENSVAEASAKAARKGARGLLYDSLELPAGQVPERSDIEGLRRAIIHLRGDSLWVDDVRVIEEIQDPDTTWADSQRFFLNLEVRGEERLWDVRNWAARADGVVGKPPSGATIALGFDGSKNRDCTVLYGWWLNPSNGKKRHGWPVQIWRRPKEAPADWRVPRAQVHEVVRDTFGTYRVLAMACDPPGWETDIDDWVEEFGEQRVVVFDTRQPSKMGPATSRFTVGMDEGDYSHDGDMVVTEHIANCGRGQRAGQEVPIKLNDNEKIDAAVAAILGNWAAETVEDVDSESSAQDYLDAVSWLCACEYRNALTLTTCRSCGTPRD